MSPIHIHFSAYFSIITTPWICFAYDAIPNLLKAETQTQKCFCRLVKISARTAKPIKKNFFFSTKKEWSGTLQYGIRERCQPGL